MRLPLSFVFLIVCTVATAQEIPALLDIPAPVVQGRPDLVQRRAALVNDRAALRGRYDSHNSQCRAVEAGSGAEAACLRSLDVLRSARAAHVAQSNDFNAAVRDALAAIPEPSPVGASGFMSDDQEREVGRRVSAVVDRQMTFVSDPAATAYLQGLIDKLAEHAPRSGVSYDVKICRNCVVEGSDACTVACSLPGGRIYVSTSLLRKAQNESELAAVLAHEISHVSARHQLTKRREAWLALLASTATPFSVFSAPLIFNSYQRDHEREADRMAVEMLYRARINPAGLVTFFDRAARQNPQGGVLDRALRLYADDHPSHQERAALAAPLLADPRYNEVRNTVDSAAFRDVHRRYTAP